MLRSSETNIGTGCDEAFVKTKCLFGGKRISTNEHKTFETQGLF